MSNIARNLMSIGPIKDPYWDSVTLLIKALGANGSQSIVDSSGSNRTLTVVGDTNVTTSDGPFSDTRSIDFDGSGDYITLDPFLLSGDFTMETFIEYDTLGGITIGNENTLLKNQQALRLVNPTHNYRNQPDSVTPAILITGGTHTTGVWYHLAVTRSGSTVRLFTNGVLDASGTDNTYAFEVACIGAIGPASGGAAFVNGRISELRITDGVARYTSAFTPPNSPFPTQ